MAAALPRGCLKNKEGAAAAAAVEAAREGCRGSSN
jgi:hypothetical protein